MRMFHAIGAAQPAVQVVRPAVIRAQKGTTIALPLDNARATMATGIAESPDCAIVAASDDDRDAGGFGGKEVAGLWQLLGAPNDEPRFSEDRLQFALEE